MIRFLCILAIIVTSTAQAASFGAWYSGEMDKGEGVFAATVNDSGGILGQYCYKEEATCLWLLSNDVDCEDKSKYGVLVNSDAGAAYLGLYCIKLRGKPRYAFSQFDDIDNLIRKSQNIGLAFPMENGQFKVSRFKLNGAKDALQDMHEKAQAYIKNGTSGTKDLRL